ncbi:MAG: PucR family transcriptional regulator ligand-binding domain-containing protein [Actinobacteria bacterium]|nr:PucR family transcriptional regulator ligand-binding domain-containing protein [Actinomycetota bacterium]
MTTSLSDSHDTDTITLGEVLEAPHFDGTQVLAGAGGLDRIVASVNIMENPDIIPWVKPGELLLTVGYSLLGGGIDVTALVERLDERGLAGFGVKLGPYIAEIGADALAVADRLGFPVLALPAAVSFDDLIADVHGARDSLLLGGLYQRRDREQELMGYALEGAGLPELAERLAVLVDAEVLVLGPAEETIAHHHGAAGDPPPRDPSDAAGSDAAVGAPIVFGSTYVGRLYVFPSGGSDARSFPGLVPTCAKIMGLAASRQIAVASVDAQFRAEFLERVLLDRLDRGEVDRRCRALEWTVSYPAVVVSLTPATLDTTPRLERAEDTLDWALRAHGLHAPHAIIAGDVVGIVGGPDPERTAAGAAEEVIARSVTGNWSAGVSGPAEDPSGLAAAWDQARLAAGVARRLHGVGATGVFSDLGVYRLLSEIDGARLQQFAADVLGPLLGDDPAMAELRRTLEVLLESNLNVARTARELHYHYNSIRYRVAQLEALVGPFTSNPVRRLELQVALLIRDTLAGAPPGRYPSSNAR